MIEILKMFFDPSGEIIAYIETVPELNNVFIQRMFETSFVFYIVVFLVFVYLFYRLFKNLWKV